MKRITLIVSLLLCVNLLFAQQPIVTWESLTKDKVKSDKVIKNPKKAKKLKTWIKRASLYFDIYSFNTSGLYKGLPAKEGIMCAERLIGVPENILSKDNKETWIYKRKKLFFVNGTLDRWEETAYIDKDALEKSAEALFEAEKIDESGKFKSKKQVMENAKNIRGALINVGITKYEEKDYKNAYAFMIKSIRLGKYPKLPTDTAFNINAVHYYSGIIAYKGDMYTEAEEHFNQCIKSDYEKGISYHYIADCYAKKGDSTEYINRVKTGFENAPNSEQLVIDLINYYINKNQPDKVIEYIDIAIAKNPDNASYYSAKATIYDNRKEDYLEKYKKICGEVHEWKKVAYRERFDPTKKADAEKKMDIAYKKTDEMKAIIDENFDKADKLYKTSIEKDPTFFNAAFNLGRAYYKRYENERWTAGWLFKVFKMKKNKETTEYEEQSMESLKKSADFFEKAYEIDNNDETTIRLLKTIYYKLKNKEKENFYKEKLKNLSQSDKPNKPDMK